MCDCASCEYTQRRSFANAPRGDPVGPRQAQAIYAEHVRHGQHWGFDSSGRMSAGPEIPDRMRRIVPEPRYPAWILVKGTMPEPLALVRDWIAKSYAWRDQVMPVWNPTPRKSRLLALAQQLRKKRHPRNRTPVANDAAFHGSGSVANL